MSNFIYYKDQKPINLDGCSFIDFENIHEDYNIIFYIYQGYGKIWTFKNQEERDKVYERIKYYYARDLEHIKVGLKHIASDMEKKALDLFGFEDIIRAKFIHEELGISKDYAKKILKRLYKKGLVVKSGRGLYQKSKKNRLDE